MRLLSGFKRFTEVAALSLYFGARPGYQRAHELVDALANRIQTYALVSGSLVPLSPPSRRDGGFGVVAGISGNAVTLAAGSTLTSGRVRLWGKSAGVYLDAGGVEGRVSGLTVYIADTTGLAAGDVVHADRLEVTSYAAAVALETALGTGHNGEIRVVNSSTGEVILRRVVRSGAWTSVEVNFAAVTATPTAAVASVAGSVVTVTAPHSLATLAKVMRVQIVTDGTWSDVASGQWSVSGNDVTVPAATAAAIAAALGASKTVRLHVEGVSELCIGGSTCALRPTATAYAYFAGSGILVSGLVAGLSVQDRCVLRARVYAEFAGANWRAMVGICESANTAQRILAGAVDVSGDTRRAAILDGGALSSNALCSFGAVVSPAALSMEAIISSATATVSGVAVNGRADGIAGNSLPLNPGLARVFAAPVFALYSAGTTLCRFERIST